jgi:hypothetical protein
VKSGNVFLLSAFTEKEEEPIRETVVEVKSDG